MRWYATLAVVLAWVINPAPALTGGMIGAGLSGSAALLAIALGSLVVALYSVPIGIAGCQTGLSTALLSRRVFGQRGSDIVAFFMGAANVIFYGVVVGIFVATLEAVLGASPGSMMVWGGVLFAIAMASSAFFGYRGLQILSNVTVPFFLLVLIISVTRAVGDAGGWAKTLAVQPTSPIAFGSAVTAAIGIFVVGATLIADVTRYARDNASSLIASLVGFGAGLTFFVGLGAIGAKAAGSGDLIQLMVSQGWLWIGALVLLLSSWTSGDNNIYSAGLALAKIFNRPKRTFTIVTVIVGAVVAATGAYQNLLAYLGFIALTIPPVGSIIAIDYFIVRREAEAEEQEYNTGALVAWALAMLIDYVAAFRMGIGASGLNGLIAGGALYYAWHALFGRR
ncbi:cytosine permease [Limnochorda pilosa]|uniref:cytosine permease n=1 Tax=Limnochorda pilosa TaxID=1555112 RepID=UPI0008302FBC|nr:cytosine permease [Limnochorda pilosa]